MIEGMGDGNFAEAVTGLFLKADSGRFLGGRSGAMKRVLEGPDAWPAIPGRAIQRFVVRRWALFREQLRGNLRRTPRKRTSFLP